MGLLEIQKLKENANLPKEKKVYRIPKQSKKKLAAIEVEKQAKIDNKPTGSLELQRWFLDRRKEMKGFCQHCGGKTEKDTDNFRCSIAHILEKSTVKSVATHPSNWLELCFYGNSCHTNLDNKMLDIMDLNCFDDVIEKVTVMYPSIAQSELRRVPLILRNYIEDNK
jgi:hypothetical protein